MEAKVITILNKLNRKDSLTGMDVWYKKVIHNVPYSIEKITDVNGQTVSMGQSYNILIPFTGLYLPYNEWINDIKDVFYTMNQGDFIVIGTEIQEIVTPNNVQTIRHKYEPNVCEVRSIIEVPKKAGVRYQLKVSGV